MDPTPVSINQTVSGQTAPGQQDFYLLTLDKSHAEWVIQLGGTVDMTFGLWETAEIKPPNLGGIRVCGKNAWGRRALAPGPHAIRVEGKAVGTYSFKVRGWSFWDYIAMKAHPNQCP